MSKDDKPTDYTPVKNVAAENVAADDATENVAAEKKAAKRSLSLSKGTIIGLSAAGVAVILGAGFAGAAIADASHHGPRGFDHSQVQGPQAGQQGPQGGQQGLGGKQHGPQGQQGQLPGQPGQGGQFVDPDPNDNDGPGTILPGKPGSVTPPSTAPSAPAQSN